MSVQSVFTPRREAIYKVFFDCAKANQPPPTYDDLCRITGLTKQTLFAHLRKFVRHGLLTHSRMRRHVYELSPDEVKAAAIQAFQEWWNDRHPLSAAPGTAAGYHDAQYIWLASRGLAE